MPDNLIFIGIGVIIILILLITFFVVKKIIDKKRIKELGYIVPCEITELKKDYSTRITNVHPYILTCVYKHNGKEYVYEQKNILNLEPFMIVGQDINVFVDPDNLNKYVIDLKGESRGDYDVNKKESRNYILTPKFQLSSFIFGVLICGLIDFSIITNINSLLLQISVHIIPIILSVILLFVLVLFHYAFIIKVIKDYNKAQWLVKNGVEVSCKIIRKESIIVRQKNLNEHRDGDYRTMRKIQFVFEAVEKEKLKSLGCKDIDNHLFFSTMYDRSSLENKNYSINDVVIIYVNPTKINEYCISF